MRLTAAVGMHTIGFTANIVAEFVWIGLSKPDETGYRRTSLVVLLALLFAAFGHLAEVAYRTIDGFYFVSTRFVDLLTFRIVCPIINLVLQLAATILMLMNAADCWTAITDFVFCLIFVNAAVFSLTNSLQVVACRQQRSPAIYDPANVFDQADDADDRRLSSDDFARLPTQVYVNSAVVIDIEPAECAICRQIYNDGDVLSTLACMHRFHEPCVRTWLTTARNACPICQRSAMP